MSVITAFSLYLYPEVGRNGCVTKAYLLLRLFPRLEHTLLPPEAHGRKNNTQVVAVATSTLQRNNCSQVRNDT